MSINIPKELKFNVESLGEYVAQPLPSKDVKAFITTNDDLKNFFKGADIIAGSHRQVTIKEAFDLEAPEIVQFLATLRRHFYVKMVCDVDKELASRDKKFYHSRLSFFAAPTDEAWEVARRTEIELTAKAKADREAKVTAARESLTDNMVGHVLAIDFNGVQRELALKHGRSMWYTDEGIRYRVIAVQANDVDELGKLDLILGQDDGSPTDTVITVDVDAVLEIDDDGLAFPTLYYVRLEQRRIYTGDEGPDDFEDVWSLTGRVEVYVHLDIDNRDVEISVYGDYNYRSTKGTFGVNWPSIGSTNPDDTKRFIRGMKVAAEIAQGWSLVDLANEDDVDDTDDEA